jgi:hypothetical protein
MSLRGIADSENFTINHETITRNGAVELQSLGILISPQLRQQFSKKLFGGDAARLETLLAQLEKAPTWRVAHRLLDNYFHSCQISPYQTAATRFSDIIYKRYFPNDVHI